MKLSRRSFLDKLAGWLSIAAVGSVAFPFLKVIFFSEKPRKSVVRIPISKLTGEVSRVNNPPMFIVKEGTSWIALDSHCTHMGCIVNYDKQKGIFICPCHGSEYNIRGINIRGPTKRPLHREPLKVSNGTIIVDYIYYKIS